MHQAALSVSSLCFSWSSSSNYGLMKTAIKTLSWAHNEINVVFKPPQQFHRHVIQLCVVLYCHKGSIECVHIVSK